MATAINNGWDFVKVGGTYQYKEDRFIAEVTVLEDNSTDIEYRFLLRVDKANMEPPFNGKFPISHVKKLGGVYGGMLQLYENPTYIVDYAWDREKSWHTSDLSDEEKSHEISKCESFEELKDAFDNIGMVNGSHSKYPPEKLKKKVDQLLLILSDKSNKMENIPFNIFTRTHGIRAKVMELTYYHIKDI